MNTLTDYILNLPLVHYIATRFVPLLRARAFDARTRLDWGKTPKETDDELINAIHSAARNIYNNGRVLLLGSGTGECLRKLRVRHTRCVDVSTEALCKCDELGSKLEQSVSIVNGDMETYRDGYIYDCVAFIESIYYVPHYRQQAMLDRLRRETLNHFGWFVITFSDAKRYHAQIEELMRRPKATKKLLKSGQTMIVCK